ncbi:MAG: hypothetical protein JXB46_03750 [Candidatus Eisenbacteria bacterium]|nr:hypothetical protein [Candidatus Eisenbacteria bacterium]
MENNGRQSIDALNLKSDLDLGGVVARLKASPNVCDQRKGRDVEALMALAQGKWSSRFSLVRAFPGPQRSLTLLCELVISGLVWRNQPEPHSDWLIALGLPWNYPLAMPGAGFLRDVPYNPHVSHRAFALEPRGLSAELHRYVEELRSGRDGGICFVRASQWTADSTRDLALLIWQISRILSGNVLYGEAAALNHSARDHYLRLKQEGKLPLGPSLPFPHENGSLQGHFAEQAHAAVSDEDPDIEWMAVR